VKKLETLYTVAESAKILNVSEKTVRRLIDDELLRAISFRRGGAAAGRCASIRQILRILSVTIEVDN
jgi:excisionase family DNA binding protein